MCHLFITGCTDLCALYCSSYQCINYDLRYLCEGSAILKRKLQAKKDQFEELQNAMDLVGFEADVCVYFMAAYKIYYLLFRIKRTSSSVWQLFLTWATLNLERMTMNTLS